MMCVEIDILNLFPIRKKINAYPREYNNFGDDYRPKW